MAKETQKSLTEKLDSLLKSADNLGGSVVTETAQAGFNYESGELIKQLTGTRNIERYTERFEKRGYVPDL